MLFLPIEACHHPAAAQGREIPLPVEQLRLLTRYSAELTKDSMFYTHLYDSHSPLIYFKFSLVEQEQTKPYSQKLQGLLQRQGFEVRCSSV